MRTYQGLIKELPENGIFVFGSNTEGRHGAGAAKVANLLFGAKYGHSSGRQGQSYAIVTKDLTKTEHPSVSTLEIMLQVLDLYIFAKENPQLDFYVAYAAGDKKLSGYSDKELAECFAFNEIPTNVIFELEFSFLVESARQLYKSNNK